jgi:hypothetical protein
MTRPERPEVWLRGPVEGVPPGLQPVAHALLQAREELHELIPGLTAEELWASPPGGGAPIGFHLRHLAGALDRLFTYARGDALSPRQREALAEESTRPSPEEVAGVEAGAEGGGDGGAGDRWAGEALLARADRILDAALAQLRGTDEAALGDPREVGRARLPSSVRGLLFHGAEHTARHAGQIATTRKLLSGGGGG